MKRLNLLLDLERLSTFYGQGNPVFMDLNWSINIFFGSCVWSLLVVSLGIFDIAALQPNWSATSTWKEEDSGMTIWTKLKSIQLQWRFFILIIPFVWILGILMSLCTVWLLSNQTWNTDCRYDSEQTALFGYNTNMGVSCSRLFFSACLRWFEQ